MRRTLTTYLIQVQDNATSTKVVIDDASESAMNISAVMEELTASMEVVATSAQEMSNSMNDILGNVEEVTVESKSLQEELQITFRLFQI